MPSIADVVTYIAAALAPIPVLLGQEFQQENETPPRVVFIPRDDRFSAPASIDRNRFHTPSVATCGVGLEARIWGDPNVFADQEEAPSYPELRSTELLRDKVIVAIRNVCEGSVSFEQGEWPDTSVMQLGRMYVLRLRIDTPIVPTDEDAETVTTTFTEVLAPEAPAAIETTVELGEDAEEIGIPSP